MEIYNVIMLCIFGLLIIGGILWRLIDGYTTKKKYSLMYYKVKVGDTFIARSADRYDEGTWEYCILTKHEGSIHYKRTRFICGKPSLLEHTEIMDWFDFVEKVGYKTLKLKYGE